jgi:hypothetical protein
MSRKNIKNRLKKRRAEKYELDFFLKIVAFKKYDLL